MVILPKQSCGGVALAQSGMSNWGNLDPHAGGLLRGEAFQFQVDVKKQMVRVKFGKRVTAEEIGKYAQKLRAHPGFQASFS